jgi:hypothetical protein
MRASLLAAYVGLTTEGERTLIKHSIATVAVVVTTATSAATAVADAQAVRTARGQTPAGGDQLDTHATAGAG